MMATITAKIIKTPIVISEEFKICDWPFFTGEDLVVSLIRVVPTVEIHKEKVILMSFHVLIGRVKRAPHWGVQSRFRVIYICMSSIVYGEKTITYVKMRGRTYVTQTRAVQKSVLGVEMKCRL